MTRTRRTVLAVAVVTALAAGGVAAARQPWRSQDDGEGRERGDETLATTTVQRTTLSSGLELTGKVGHGPATEIVGQGRGTFTKLPRPGDRITAGGMLYELDAEPVVLFAGSRPFWRDITTGVKGPDVQQLERNLTDLGYASATNLTVDEEFTDNTAAAVKSWQKALGLKQTGKVELGRVVVLSDRVVRVEEVTAKVGGTAVAGSDSPVLKVAKPDLFATVRLDDDQIAQLMPGRGVTVRFDSGGETKGKVKEISRGSGGGDGAGGGDSGGGNGGDSGGDVGKDQATATISLTDQKKAEAALDQARPTITVTVPDEKAEDALVVPVTALLARPEGGYGVQVARPGRPEPALVRVKVGLIVGARAQVTPDSDSDADSDSASTSDSDSGTLREGDKVVIPS
ncbi:peptidoglycan-binding domain-containing protein [Streptomyces sp. NBC_00878]|uniref:peptidoglycan-binding protein n=1 Tax=Streptomyces sp. NBC_00878 TaxID=2975854 RepID=UPI002250FF64|nr:peptidoglycan-binding domain-containing protein [Streptomyces sp. NBC_00878]MCX4903946.1 peptidoglycan-binding protein [Streptomyces sp. NBC_00878]